MKIVSTIKSVVMICLGLAAAIAGISGLAFVFAEKSGHIELRPSPPSFAGLNDEPSHIRSIGAAPAHVPDPQSAPAPDQAVVKCGNKIEDAEYTAGIVNPELPGSNAAPAAGFNVSGGTDIQEASESEKSRIAGLKEKIMRERFGVICRRGKWIPTVNGGTDMVYITTGTIPPGRVGENYEIQFQAESGSPPYLWSIAEGALPKSISFAADSGKLSGMPVEPTTAPFLIEVTDSMGSKDMAEYILVFQPEQVLEIVTETLPAARPGEEYFFSLQASGGVPPYAWSASGNPGEIGSLVMDTLTGQLCGQISASAPRTDIPLVVWLSDSQLRVSKEFLLYIRHGLSILDAPPSSLRVSDSFEFAFQAAGGSEPYLWSLSGSLPPGMDFSDSGLLSGAPEEAGIYDISVWVRDEEGQNDALQFQLEVLPVLEASVSGFQALLSRNSVALSWEFPPDAGNSSVRIVRNSAGNPCAPSDGNTVYCGSDTSYVDGDVGAGAHYYAAFLEENGMAVTSIAPPALCAKLPPDIDPFADGVASANLLHPNAFRSGELPGIVLGAPRGMGLAWGSADVVSLGAAVNDDGSASAPYGGEITLEFTDNCVWDGPGADFTVFENVFYIGNSAGSPDPETRFMEPAVVAVSKDGVNWRQFKFDFSPRYHPDTGELNLRHPYCYNSGFAGVNPVMSNGYDPDPTDPAVSGGDSFDIAEVGLDWIRFVRIQSTGSRWLVDYDGDYVLHTEEMDAATRSSNKAGFDLDAVTAIWMRKIASTGDAE